MDFLIGTFLLNIISSFLADVVKREQLKSFAGRKVFFTKKSVII